MDMGFKYKTINHKRLVFQVLYYLQHVGHFRTYYEQPGIAHQRHVYLRRMRRNWTEEKPVVYLNETWANAHHGKKKPWIKTDTTTRGTIGGVQGYVVMYFMLYVF